MKKRKRKTVSRVFQDDSNDRALQVEIWTDTSPAGYVTPEREAELRKLAALPAAGPNLAMVLVARDCIALLDESRAFEVQTHHQRTVLDPLQEVTAIVSRAILTVAGALPNYRA